MDSRVKILSFTLPIYAMFVSVCKEMDSLLDNTADSRKSGNRCLLGEDGKEVKSQDPDELPEYVVIDKGHRAFVVIPTEQKISARNTGPDTKENVNGSSFHLTLRVYTDRLGDAKRVSDRIARVECNRDAVFSVELKSTADIATDIDLFPWMCIPCEPVPDGMLSSRYAIEVLGLTYHRPSVLPELISRASTYNSTVDAQTVISLARNHIFLELSKKVCVRDVWAVSFFVARKGDAANQFFPVIVVHRSAEAVESNEPICLEIALQIQSDNRKPSSVARLCLCVPVIYRDCDFWTHALMESLIYLRPDTWTNPLMGGVQFPPFVNENLLFSDCSDRRPE
jgi:hypothetical protein